MDLDKDFEERIKAATTLEELAQPLEELLSGRYSIWYDGRLYLVKAIVDQIRDLKIIIRPNDHPPPHFHAIGQNFNVVFEIETGDLMEGRIDPIHHRLVRKWHKDAIPLLQKMWLETRPSG